MFGKLFGKKEENEVIDKPAEKTIEVIPMSESNVTAPSKENVDVVISPKEDSKEEKTEVPPLTYREMKHLKRSRYETDVMNNPKFKKAYLLKNIKTGQMAEIRAASSFHACNIIGWKANRVQIISEKEIKEAAPETTSSSNNPS